MFSNIPLSAQGLEDQIAACESQIKELKAIREERLRCEEERAADLKQCQDKQEITKIFSSIQNQIPRSQYAGYPFTKACEHDLNNLRVSLETFRRFLLREVDIRTDDFSVRTAYKLEETIDQVFTSKSTLSQQINVIDEFRDMAREAKFSHYTKVAISTLLGALVGLALWMGLTIASGGLASLVTFPSLGLAALIATYSATHFYYRSDIFMRSSNPNETRGKQVSDNLKTILRYRNELFAPAKKNIPPENTAKPSFSASKAVS